MNLINDNLVYHNENGIEYIQFKRLLQYPEIAHCYTLKSGSLLDFSKKNNTDETLKRNYERICNCLDIDAKSIVRPHQTHTDNVVAIDGVCELNEVDGVVTNKKGITLLTTSADCTSLLLYDPVKKIIGAIHSGWRGTLQGIAKKAIEKMIEEYKTDPKDVICCICPCIRSCHFEVEEDVKEQFAKTYCNLGNINDIIRKDKVIDGKQKYYIDTVQINKELLRSAGLKDENIIDSGICTVCNSNKFHSYRADKEHFGLNAGVIGREK